MLLFIIYCKLENNILRFNLIIIHCILEGEGDVAKTEIPGRPQGFLGCHGTTYFQRRKQIFHNYSHD